MSFGPRVVEFIIALGTHLFDLVQLPLPTAYPTQKIVNTITTPPSPEFELSEWARGLASLDALRFS